MHSHHASPPLRCTLHTAPLQNMPVHAQPPCLSPPAVHLTHNTSSDHAGACSCCATPARCMLFCAACHTVQGAEPLYVQQWHLWLQPGAIRQRASLRARTPGHCSSRLESRKSPQQQATLAAAPSYSTLSHTPVALQQHQFESHACGVAATPGAYLRICKRPGARMLRRRRGAREQRLQRLQEHQPHVDRGEARARLIHHACSKKATPQARGCGQGTS